MRRWVIRITALFVGIVVLSLAVYVWVWDMYTPRAEGYELSGNSREINVAFCGGTADTIDARTLREDENRVVVGVRLRMHRDQFEHGTVQRASFALRTELAGRVVQDESGNAVPQTSQFLCPG
jgi:hypothetical protein